MILRGMVALLLAGAMTAAPGSTRLNDTPAWGSCL